MKQSTTQRDRRLHEAWLRSGVLINASVCLSLALVIGVSAAFGDVPLHRTPAMWGALAVVVFSGLEWWSLSVRRRLVWGGRAMPIVALGAAIIATATRTPEAFIWVLTALFLVFMRFPLRTAQLLSLGAVLTAGLLVWLHWQQDIVVIVRTLASGLFLTALLSNFFGTSDEISRELTESSRLLSSTLESMAQGLVVIGPDSRIKLFNDKACEMLDLPQPLMQTKPLLREIVQQQASRGDFGTDFDSVQGDARAHVASHVDDRQIDMPLSYTRRTPDGRYIEVTTRPMPSGDVVRTYADVTAHEQMNAQLQELLRDYGDLRRREMQRSRERLIDALCMLSKYRDNETGQHIVRTQLYMRTLAETLAQTGRHGDALSPEQIDLMVKAAPMHDLGKIGIPDHILLKPGRHTPEETVLMRTHAAIGESTLMIAAKGQGTEQSVLMTAARIAGGHHEHWDGSGYPRALKGAEIPLEARLMSLADVYDALTTLRPYKRPWTHEEASAEIHRLAGTKFDPEVVAAFDLRAETFREIACSMRDADDAVLSAA